MKNSDNLKIMTLPKIFKNKLFLLILVSLFFLFVPTVRAMVVDGGEGTAGPGHYQFEVWEPAVYQTQEMNQQSFANETIRATIASFNDKILGCINCPPEAQGQSAIQGVGNLIAGMYANPPASSVEYFADLGRNLGIAQPAYAQGIGFEGLKPILSIWKAFRNIAYLFFVIIFVFIGFAIMFRLKIDPQTVISIQNALPKVIVALILVTFSYAIAGLLIDLIYVFISLLFAVLGTQLAAAGGITGIQQLLGENVFTASWRILGGWQFVTAPASGIDNIIRALVGNIPLLSNILGRSVGLVATFIFAIAMAFAMFKLFFSLLISYISIIVGVIFAPLMLMLEALPGQRGLSSWLKMMLSNIIVFPLTAAIFMLGAILTHGFSQAEQAGWVAPFLGAEWGASALPPLIGLGIVLLAPSIVDMVKKAIGAPGLAEGIGGPLAVGARVPYVAGEEIYRKLTEKRRLLKEARAKLDAEREMRKRMQEGR